MKTLIVRCGNKVRFLVTNHPEYRFSQLAKQMPVPIELFGVTDVRAKDIKIGLSSTSEWYCLSPELEGYLASII